MATPPAAPPPHNLHLQGNRWTVSCPTCGCEITSHPDQDVAEERAARWICRICRSR